MSNKRILFGIDSCVRIGSDSSSDVGDFGQSTYSDQGRRKGPLPSVFVGGGLGWRSPELDARRSGGFRVAEVAVGSLLETANLFSGVALIACALK